MKNVFFLIFLFIIANTAFAQENETPAFMMELNSGYAMGVNIPNEIPIELKIVYPFTRFGLTLECGALLYSDTASQSDKANVHFFIGPTFFVINNPKIRLPISLGFDVLASDTPYFGLGGIVSFNYSLTKNIYIGINAEVNYYLNNPYDETVRIDIKDASIGIDPTTGNHIYPIDDDGNPVYYTRTPIIENKDHYGSYIHIKPTIAIGIQF